MSARLILDCFLGGFFLEAIIFVCVVIFPKKANGDKMKYLSLYALLALIGGSVFNCLELLKGQQEPVWSVLLTVVLSVVAIMGVIFTQTTYVYSASPATWTDEKKCPIPMDHRYTVTLALRALILHYHEKQNFFAVGHVLECGEDLGLDVSLVKKYTPLDQVGEVERKEL